MGYRIRVLGVNPELPDLQYLRKCLADDESSAILKADSGMEQDWKELVLAHPDGIEISLLECNRVINGELGQDELNEFIEEVEFYKPSSAAAWLKEYLPSIKVIYAFQLLSGTDVNDGWNAVHAVQNAIWNKVGGILQADGEGFSNEDGYHILWQFSDTARGTWKMAVLDQGKWVAFEMELGDINQRKEFSDGKVPREASLLH